jgi:hypothetical protein
MNTNEPLIEITRTDNILSSVKVIMPTWNELRDDNKTYCKIPLLGGLNTYAMNDNDAQIAVKEAIHCFCIAAEKFGQGLENELIMLGWQELSKTDNVSVFSIHTDIAAFELILETGETTAVQVEITAEDTTVN